MEFKKKALLIVAVFFMVLAIDYLFLHFIFPLKKQRILKEANQEVESSLEQHPPSPSNKKLENLVNSLPTSELDFKTASQNCLGSTWSSYENFPQELEKTYRVQSKTVDIENYHLKLPSGEERRIHIVSDGRQGDGAHRTVRHFGVDADGLPRPLALPGELRSQPVQQIIETLKSEGEIFHHQSKQRWLLGNGSTLIVTFENGKPLEFQLFGSDKTFSCLKNSCQCL